MIGSEKTDLEVEQKVSSNYKRKETYLHDHSDSDIWYKPHLYRDTHDSVKSKLICIVGLCSFFIIAEIIGAYLSNSIAIYTDVIHLSSDLLGFLFSLVSVHYASLKSTKEYSYGYLRAEILGALSSVIIIWVMSLWIGRVSYVRFMKIVRHQPVHLDPSYMVITSLLGLTINIIMALTLHSNKSGPEDHDVSQSNVTDPSLTHKNTPKNLQIKVNKKK